MLIVSLSVDSSERRLCEHLFIFRFSLVYSSYWSRIFVFNHPHTNNIIFRWRIVPVLIRYLLASIRAESCHMSHATHNRILQISFGDRVFQVNLLHLLIQRWPLSIKILNRLIIFAASEHIVASVLLEHLNFTEKVLPHLLAPLVVWEIATSISTVINCLLYSLLNIEGWFFIRWIIVSIILINIALPLKKVDILRNNFVIFYFF